MVLKKYSKTIASLLLLVIATMLVSFQSEKDKRFTYYIVQKNNPKLKMYLKDSNGKHYGSLKNLKNTVEEKGSKLLFAMNGGMYQKDHYPQGLYIENGNQIKAINKVQKAFGNFYLQPNGIFYILKDGSYKVEVSSKYNDNTNIQYATQSGPMLLIDGAYHSALMKGSNNTNIRNGVGILPNGDAIFAISNEKVNFYDFATFFKSKGCKNALYLDGFVSKAFIPSKGKEELSGNFGVIIGVEE